MRVVVLGAGVVGTTAAWYLAGAGHEVAVIERREFPGLETSFANGGQISPCHAEPWANPRVITKLAKWLGRDDAPLLFRWMRWDPALWAWGLRFLANCTPGRAKINIERTLRIALYSRHCLQNLRSEIGLEYDQRTGGILHVYRDPKEFAHARAAARAMEDLGLTRLETTPDECVVIEPALASSRSHLAGGIHTPDDESGDAYLFTRRLADQAERIGVTFHTGITVRGFETSGQRITATITDRGPFAADAVVLALGSYSPLLARQLGLGLPIVPAKGYSVTVPLGVHGGAPTVSITDDEYKMVYSRLGQRLRIAGTAETAGWDTTLKFKRWNLLVERARQLFPDGGDYAEAQPWAGLRPVTPDSVPLLGPTPYENLWLNTGHGTLGWTMACGSGRLIADLISGKRPEIPIDGLGLERFSSY